jgi:hypothetical protein
VEPAATATAPSKPATPGQASQETAGTQSGNPSATVGQGAVLGSAAPSRRVPPGFFVDAVRARHGVLVRGRLFVGQESSIAACTGKVRVGRRAARVRRDCTFRMRLRTRTRRLSVRFAGNKLVAPAATSVRVRSR